jgi:hypothetical protein
MAKHKKSSNKQATAKQATNQLIDESAEKNVEDQIQPKKTLFKKLLPWLIVSILVIAVVFGGWFTYQYTRTDADAMANKMMGAIINNNQTSAYNLTSPTFRLNTSQSQLASSLNQINTYLKGGSYKQTDRYFWSANGQIVSVSTVYAIKTLQKTYYARILLDKVNGKWLVSVFRISETELKAVEP